MKRLIVLILALGVFSTASGVIRLKVHESDGQTPFDPNNGVMVGTHLTITVNSDSNDYWNGGLFIAGEDRNLGRLRARGFDPNAGDWVGSHYDDAGQWALVTDWNDSAIWGYDLRTYYSVDANSDNNSTSPGDWFVIDYHAEKAGDCNIGFYDYSVSWDDPNYYLVISNVPTRDLNADDSVNFADFAILAPMLFSTDCNEPNWCDGADLDGDGIVDGNDLALFAEYWLWPSSPHTPDIPGDTNYPQDANIIYSIVDANGSSEITIDINDSITLYVDIATTEANDVWVFDIEVDISDTNLGYIDNTEYPYGTAEILAEPNRDSGWDYWGPGSEQEEAIRLTGLTTGNAIADGHLASFVFTCSGQGDVTLDLVNLLSLNTDDIEVFPMLESITIHQVDPNSQQMMGGGMIAMMVPMESQTMPESSPDDTIDWLENLWLEEEVLREMYSEAEWDEFVESVRDAYQ